MNRRDFLSASAGMLALAACAPTSPLAGGPPQRAWGVQLFTVIALLEQDFEGTLRDVAAIGYREVETIGSFGRDPAYVKSLFDRFGLVSPSQHIAPNELYGSFSGWARKEISREQNRANYIAALDTGRALDAVADAIAKARALSQQYVVWPILLPQHVETRAILDSYIRIFNEAGDMCDKAGLTFAFHNHDREFARIGNDVIYDLILANSDARKVKMEMDFFWISKAGADPFAYLGANPGRFFGCHVKDRDAKGDFADVGSGTLEIPRLIKAARASGVEHFYVEYDRSDDPMRAIRNSFAYLHELS